MNTFSKISGFKFGYKQNIITNIDYNYLTKNITNNVENRLLSAILSSEHCIAFDTTEYTLLLLKLENNIFKRVEKIFVIVILKIEFNV